MNRVFVVCLAVVSLLLPLQAQGNGVFTSTAPLSVVTVNPCNGAVVLLSGTTHGVLRVTPSQVLFQLHGHLVGADVATGDAYIANIAQTLVINRSEWGAIVNNQQNGIIFPFVNLNLVSLGPAPNYFLHINAHLTVTPSGITHFVDNVNITCSPN